MSNNYLISHIDCDGSMAVVVAYLFNLIEDENDVYLMDYKDMFVDDEKTQSAVPLRDDKSKVYYVDLNIAKPVYNAFTQYYGYENCLFLDHHQESLEFKDESNAIVNNKKCGTLLLFEYLSKGKRVPGAWKEFAVLVDVYDRWLIDSPLREKAENLNRVMYRVMNWKSNSYYGKLKPFIDLQYKKLISKTGMTSGEFFFTDFEKHQIELAKEKEEREYEYAIENMQIREDSKGNTFVLYHGASKISYVCHRILQDNPEFTYVIAINTFTGNPRKREITGKVSVRSREGEFECPTLKNINGHLAAAGGELDSQFVKDLLYGKHNDLGFEESA